MNLAATTPALPLLLIEDEPSVIAFMQAALERSGYQVVPATSGSQALSLLAEGRFLGVITDIRTPGGVNGGDVHDWLCLHRQDLVGRVIFVTGDTVSEETRSLLERTGAPCIEKPFRVQQLIEAVEQTFGGGR